MNKQSIRGFLMGAVLGLALWLMAALAIFYSLGYLPHILPYLWWSLGILMTIAGVELRLTSMRERPATALRLTERS
jgi:hypothetical protein